MRKTQAIPQAQPEPGHVTQGIMQDRLLELVGYNCRQVSTFMGAKFAKKMAKIGLRRMEFAVLMLVRENEQINQKRLAEVIQVAPSNLNLVLDRLESVGWLVRYRNPIDKRSQFVKLTLRGIRKCRSAEIAAIETENEITASLSASERSELVRLLRKVHLEARPRLEIN